MKLEASWAIVFSQNLKPKSNSRKFNRSLPMKNALSGLNIDFLKYFSLMGH